MGDASNGGKVVPVRDDEHPTGVGESEDGGDVGNDERGVEIDTRRGTDDHGSSIVGRSHRHRRSRQLQRRYDRRLGRCE